MAIKHRGTRRINAQNEPLEVDKRRRGLFAGLRYIWETDPIRKIAEKREESFSHVELTGADIVTPVMTRKQIDAKYHKMIDGEADESVLEIWANWRAEKILDL